jgi:hypothetical protein
MVRPDTATTILVPIEEVANVPVAPAVFSVIASPFATPARVAPVVSREAVGVPSYALLFALMPVTVSVFGATACDKTSEVLPVKLLSPPYIAEIECGEPATESVEVAKVATLGFAPFNVPVPNVATPSLKATVPPGDPPTEGMIVAVKVTELP